MKRILEIGTGLAISAAAFGGIDSADKSVVNAEFIDTPTITVAGYCSDGAAFDSNPEVTVFYSWLASKTGQFVNTSVNGVDIDNYQVTADKTEHSVQIQSEAGHLDIVAHIAGNIPHLIPVDILSCETVDTTPSGDMNPAEVPGPSLPKTGAGQPEVATPTYIAGGSLLAGIGAMFIARRKTAKA